ncbi:MAG: ribosome silencing factor [Rhodothermales bacterium]
MKSLEKQITTTRKAKKKTSHNPAHVLAAQAVDAMLEKKAHDVTVLDMRSVSGVADFFVIGTGDSELQVKAIADSVRDRIRENCQEKPWHAEGTDHWQWVLIDYVDVVAHVFSPDRRSFYDLERLWGDAPREVVPDESSAAGVKILQTAAEKKPSRRTTAGGEK